MRRTKSLLLALSLSFLFACGSDAGDAASDGNDGSSGHDGDKGKDGSDGSDGSSGRDGQNSLIRLDDEPAGSNCPHGGTAVRSGLDANGNGVLDDHEVTQTIYVCSGANGQDGALVRLDDEPAGANCPHGGTAVKSGVDANKNGKLDDDEVTGTQYVCNGGVVGDVTITSLEGVQALAGVRHIVGVLTIEGGLQGELELPDIEIVEGDQLLAFDSLELVGGFELRDSRGIASLTLPALVKIRDFGLSIGGYSGTEANSLLETLSAPKLVTVDGSIYLRRNVALTNVKVEGTVFYVTNNPSLPACAAEDLYNQLDLPRPANKTIIGNLGTCP